MGRLEPANQRRGAPESGTVAVHSSSRQGAQANSQLPTSPLDSKQAAQGHTEPNAGCGRRAQVQPRSTIAEVEAAATTNRQAIMASTIARST